MRFALENPLQLEVRPENGQFKARLPLRSLDGATPLVEEMLTHIFVPGDPAIGTSPVTRKYLELEFRDSFPRDALYPFTVVLSYCWEEGEGPHDVLAELFRGTKPLCRLVYPGGLQKGCKFFGDLDTIYGRLKLSTHHRFSAQSLSGGQLFKSTDVPWSFALPELKKAKPYVTDDPLPVQVPAVCPSSVPG